MSPTVAAVGIGTALGDPGPGEDRSPLACPGRGGSVGGCHRLRHLERGVRQSCGDVSRVFTDTYTGIAPGSVLGFLIAQVAGGVFAALVAPMFFPDPVTSETK